MNESFLPPPVNHRVRNRWPRADGRFDVSELFNHYELNL
jgi:hypothetical protein